MPDVRELPMDAHLTAFFSGSPIHPVAARILASRGIVNAQDVKAFVHPDWKVHIHDPFLFSHMEEAVQRVFRAIYEGERITVYGDYDADGVTGSAVIIEAIRSLSEANGIRLRHTPHAIPVIVDSYIPHRDNEGYGLHPASVRRLYDRGTKLIITVDCGIANVQEIALARSLGMDVIVVDHHEFGDELPDSIIIHPRIPNETYPFKYLAAVGVAWKFATALFIEARRTGIEIADGAEKWLLDLVSIATVTDMVPLVGENRVLEVYGLKVLNKTRRPGLRMLIQSAGMTQGSLTTDSIGFGIGPRINAAGRMDHASLALRLLLAETDEEATDLAEQIEGQNRDRQKAVARIMKEAEAQYEAKNQTSAVLAFWSDAWPPALVGLVAGRFLDRTGCPTIAIGKHGEKWTGSGRSFMHYDITAAVKRAGEGILSRAGGHIQACGFSFSGHDPQEFAERLFMDANHVLSNVDCSPTLQIDAELGFEELNWSLVETLDLLEPFGIGFARPKFLTTKLFVTSADLVGQTQKHLRCVLTSSSGRSVKFIGFNLADRKDIVSVGKTVDVVYDVGVNEWKGKKNLQCKLVDVRAV